MLYYICAICDIITKNHSRLSVKLVRAFVFSPKPRKEKRKNVTVSYFVQ